MGKVRCWTIHDDVHALENDLSDKLRVATGLNPEVTWRYSDPRASGDVGVRISVVASGYRIEVQVVSMWTGQAVAARPTGEQTITISVNPV